MALASSSSPSSSAAFAARSYHRSLVWPRTRQRPAETVAAAPLRRPMAARVEAALPAGKSRLAGVWRKIQGADDWSGMVEPLDPLLREEVIRYGELVAACYKAFDLEPGSKRYLNCKYGKSSLLREVGLTSAGYVITKYIYATPDIGLPASGGRGGRWIGYVAVADDEEARRLGRRDVVVSFRGTVTGAEWVANLMSSLAPANLDPLGGGGADDVRVESGFLSLHTSDDSSCRFSHGSCREQLLSEVARLVAQHGEDEEMSITVAGHSMGAALALLLSYDVAELGLHRPRRRYKRQRGELPPIPVTVYSFGGPRVGNVGFKWRCEELGVKVLRVVNVHDPVTKLPGLFLNERWGGPWGCGACYAHVGVELALEFFKVQNPASVHDLEAYVGLLRCPKVARVRREGADLVERTRKMMRMESLQGWPWQDVARHVGDLVQSLSLI